MKTALTAALWLALQAPAAAPDPRRPAPTFDSVAPELPALTRPAVLIVSKTNGYRHDSIAQAVPAIEARVKARGWSSFATEDAAVFNPGQLAKFDVIVFANASGDITTPASARRFGRGSRRGAASLGSTARATAATPTGL